MATVVVIQEEDGNVTAHLDNGRAIWIKKEDCINFGSLDNKAWIRSICDKEDVDEDGAKSLMNFIDCTLGWFSDKEFYKNEKNGKEE